MEIQRFSIHLFYLPLCLLGAPPHREPASEFTCREEGPHEGEKKTITKKCQPVSHLRSLLICPQ